MEAATQWFETSTSRTFFGSHLLQELCVKKVKAIQEMALSQGLVDIFLNFLIGGDGNFYEGVGETFHDNALLLYSNLGLLIGFIGNFTEVVPLNHTATLNTALKGLIHLSPSYKIIFANQLMDLRSPTTQTLVALRRMPRFHECKHQFLRIRFGFNLFKFQCPMYTV